MRAVRERPRVVVVVGWLVLALLLLGALIGATAASGGGGDREALEAARLAALEARVEADGARAEVGELARALKAERRQVTRLRGELRSARRAEKTKRR